MTGSRVGASLRSLRAAAGMTQDELARAVGVGTSHLRAVETGATMPSTAFLAAACAVLAARLREQSSDGHPRET